jgi:hypothetical protein
MLAYSCLIKTCLAPFDLEKFKSDLALKVDLPALSHQLGNI